MAHTYTPGLTVTPRTVVSKKRILPLSGTVLVEASEAVTSATVVIYGTAPVGPPPATATPKPTATTTPQATATATPTATQSATPTPTP